jgi:hypothetical protein
MKRLLIAAGLVLAASAVHAQSGPAPAAPATSQQEAQARAAVSGHTPLVYHGPHRYPSKTRGRAGDPPVIDHSMDTLVVEPTHSTITITVPSPLQSRQ